MSHIRYTYIWMYKCSCSFSWPSSCIPVGSQPLPRNPTEPDTLLVNPQSWLTHNSTWFHRSLSFYLPCLSSDFFFSSLFLSFFLSFSSFIYLFILFSSSYLHNVSVNVETMISKRITPRTNRPDVRCALDKDNCIF